jgi:hypothetical protein
MRCLKLFLMFSVLVLLASACSVGTKKVETIGESHTGTQGIYFDFVPNYPPAVIYTSGGEETGNNIILDVKNLGSFKTGAYFHLSGFDPTIININNPLYISGTIDAKSATNPEGGYTQIQFPAYGTLSVFMPKGMDVYPFTVQATASYGYKTQASLPVCVDPNPYSPITQRACVPHGATLGGGQGAPVAVTSVEQESLKGQTIFKIRIANVGDGQVIKSGLSPKCTDLKYNEFDIIEYRAFSLGGRGGRCTPGNPVRLVNKQALITCVFNVPGELAYTTTLDVDMSYDYMASKQRSVQIKKIS